mgnify:FL=1
MICRHEFRLFSLSLRLIVSKTLTGVNVAKNYYDITLALAGICQAARLVQQLAHEGHCSQEEMSVSLRSLLEMNPASTLAVYGNNEANL